MKMEGNESRMIAVCEDSGVVTSGELGEPSCSGEYEGVDCIAHDELKKDYDNQNPRYTYIYYDDIVSSL